MIAVCQAEIGPKYRTWRRQNVNSKDSFNAEVFPKIQNNDRPGSTKPKAMIFPGKHRKGRHSHEGGRDKGQGKTQTINTHNMTTGDEISERTADIICKRRR